MKKAYIILLSILFIGCSEEENQSTPANLEVGKGTTLNHDQCLSVTGTAYDICLESISDSRCPDGLTCVWEGDAVATFIFKSSTKTHSFSLHTYRNFRQDTIINGLKIELLEVIPYPVLNEKVDPKDYSVEILISDQ